MARLARTLRSLSAVWLWDHDELLRDRGDPAAGHVARADPAGALERRDLHFRHLLSAKHHALHPTVGAALRHDPPGTRAGHAAAVAPRAERADRAAVVCQPAD